MKLPAPRQAKADLPLPSAEARHAVFPRMRQEARRANRLLIDIAPVAAELSPLQFSHEKRQQREADSHRLLLFNGAARRFGLIFQIMRVTGGAQLTIDLFLATDENGGGATTHALKGEQPIAPLDDQTHSLIPCSISHFQYFFDRKLKPSGKTTLQELNPFASFRVKVKELGCEIPEIGCETSLVRSSLKC